MWESKEPTHFSHSRRARAEIDLFCQLGPSQKWWLGPSSLRSEGSMTADANSLSVILRDEIERKLDRILEELQIPAAIGYSARRGHRPRKD
jgi:hypothetical protein